MSARNCNVQSKILQYIALRFSPVIPNYRPNQCLKRSWMKLQERRLSLMFINNLFFVLMVYILKWLWNKFISSVHFNQIQMLLFQKWYMGIMNSYLYALQPKPSLISAAVDLVGDQIVTTNSPVSTGCV